jgi:hypothetical protein
MSAGSPSAGVIRHPRLVAYQQLITAIQAARPAVTGGSAWNDFLNRLPLTLGESTAERVAPYSVSDSVLAAFHQAVDSLVDLIKRRADPAYDDEKKSVLLPDESARVVLRPRRFCPRTIPEESPPRSVVRLSLLESPELDAGLMESWLTRAAGGQDLCEKLKTLLSKALATARSQQALSGAVLLTHLATLQTLLAAKDRIKRERVRNMSYARLERAVGMALHACFNLAVRDALSTYPRHLAGTPEYTDTLIILASLGPLAFFSTGNVELSEDVNPYGLSEEVEELLDPIYRSLLESGNTPRYLLNECLRIAYNRPSLLQTLTRQAACEAFRRLALDHLMAAEDPACKGDQLLAQAFYKNDALLVLMEETTSLNHLVPEFHQRIRERGKADEAPAEMNRLCAFLEQIQAGGPPWKKSHHGLDEFATAHIQKVRRHVVDRRRSCSTAALIQEYEAGRLYRISDDELPLIKARIVSEEAQVFVDLKGFTRRTARAKELVMAEFLKAEFYQPILDAAKAYYSGVSAGPGSESIQLVNLLGDAVAFSGDILSIVGLARDIQKISRDYTHKLEELAPEEEENSFQALRQQVQARRAGIASEIEEQKQKVESIREEILRRRNLRPAEMLDRLQKDFQEQFSRLQQEHQNLQARAKSAGDSGEKAGLTEIAGRLRSAHERLSGQRQRVLKRLKKLQEEDRTRLLLDLLCQKYTRMARETEEAIGALEEEDRSLLDALEEERTLRMGMGLEAGLFISYGAASEHIEIDDDIWGFHRVSVSERINEAARGTARNMTVKRRLDQLLAAARVDRANPMLELPFRVYISHTRTVDAEKAGLRPHPQAHNDIHNLGEAISEPALNAYIRQARTERFFFRIQVRTADLHPEIQDRFLFVDDMLTLIVSKPLAAHGEGEELFRYVGQVLFRGFEVTRPTRVYEILRPEEQFSGLLLERHVQDWLAEADQNPACRLEDLA